MSCDVNEALQLGGAAADDDMFRRRNLAELATKTQEYTHCQSPMTEALALSLLVQHVGSKMAVACQRVPFCALDTRPLSATSRFFLLRIQAADLSASQ